MGETAKKEQMNFSIWDSVVNDRIIQYEILEGKYRSIVKRVEELTSENERLKEQMELVNSHSDDVREKISVLENEVLRLKQENRNLQQHIYNMENSTSWKVTKPIRSILDKVK